MRTIAHRGCAARGPENTLLAVRRAVPHVDAVEVDVRRCGSGELVAFHDESLGRLTGAAGAVSETDWDRLRELRILDTDERVPRFADIVAAVPPSVAIAAELKHRGMAADVRSLLVSSSNDALVSSFVPGALAEVGAVDADLPRALLFEDDWAGNLTRATDLGCEVVHAEYRLLLGDADRVAGAHEAGVSVEAWTVPTRDAVTSLRDAGADGVIVDDWSIVPDAGPDGEGDGEGRGSGARGGEPGE